MALIKCPDCGKEISDTAPTCVQCGRAMATPAAPPKPEAKGSAVQAVFGLLVAAGFGWYFFGGGQERVVEQEINKIEQKVAADFVKQYEMAKRNGTAIDLCVQAGQVAAGFQQAGDEPNYARWKKIEAADCEAAADVHVRRSGRTPG